MGVFDTIYFDKAYSCSQCSAAIDSTQTKAFEQTLSYYHVKDCVSHAEDIRIVKEELCCNACGKSSGQYVYIAVHRGILVGVSDTLPLAQSMLNDVNLEKMILWYHDLFKKFREEAREKANAIGFMENTVQWFEKGCHRIEGENDYTNRGLFFIMNKAYLENVQEPIESIKKYLAANEKKDEE